MAPKKPKVVCLCGSTQFKDAFIKANKEATLAGYIVLSVGFFVHTDDTPISKKQKAALDELHLRKIDLADGIMVLNVGGYIGESTSREITYALEHGKVVTFLEGDC